MEEHGDFLYFVILKIFVDLGIPVQFATAIFATFFYKGGLTILQDNFNLGSYSGKSKNLAEIALFFTVPIHLVLSIARMTCSFSFVFYAIHMYNNRKYIRALFLASLAICAHTGTALFLGIFLVFVLLFLY